MSPRSRSWRFPRAQATTLPTSTARGICKESSPRFRGQKMFMGESRNKSDERKPGVALTRREWLMSLGSAVVLSGFRGAPGLVQPDSHAARAPLPPGLYQPSLDHLSHALDSKGAFLPIPPGAATEYARPHSGVFVPRAFAAKDSLGSAKNRSGASGKVSSVLTPAAKPSSSGQSATLDRIGLRLMQARACSISSRRKPSARFTPRAWGSKSSTITETPSMASRPAAASRLDCGPLGASRSNWLRKRHHCYLED